MFERRTGHGIANLSNATTHTAAHSSLKLVDSVLWKAGNDDI
jgi:hypothetical protein